jgi:peptide methionine sulfoxide reductase MsrA
MLLPTLPHSSETTGQKMTTLALSASLRPSAAAKTSRRRRVEPKVARAFTAPEADDDARNDRRQQIVGWAASALLLSAPHAAHAETMKDMYIAAGRYAFLEKEFNDLRYAGVKEVVPGLASGVPGDESSVDAVKVTYDEEKISHEKLMQTYWKHVDPTRGDGQFKENGAKYRAAIWVDGPAERKEVETNLSRLQNSEIFGKGKALVTPVLDAPPKSFDPYPEDQWKALTNNPKAYEKDKAERQKAFDKLWGFVQYCANRLCGYVRFAPNCTGECLETFPELRERNFGQPELIGDIKITGGSGR